MKKTFALVFFALVTVAVSLSVSRASSNRDVYSAKEYKYKCPKDGQIFTYDKPGNYKCPTHKDKSLTPVK